MKAPRKLHIKSYGCQMNVYDAQRMVDTLAGEGFVETSSVDVPGFHGSSHCRPGYDKTLRRRRSHHDV